MTPQTPTESAVTQCPHCSAKFRVRQAQVTLHAGLVRCGACRGIFDAVEHVVEGKLTLSMPEIGVDGIEAPQTIVQDVAALKTSDSAPAGVQVEEIYYPSSAPTGTGVSFNQAMDTAQRNPDTRARTQTGIGSMAGGGVSDYQRYRWRAPKRATTPAMRVVYGLLSALALVALLAQTTYWFRDEIASRMPAAVPALAAACEYVRCRVQPPQRADALGFVSADLAADPAHKGLLIFTVTLRNTGVRAVAYPHLVLSLDALGGEVAARRIFSPPEFLPASANIAKGLDANAEVEIKLYLDASQSNVVGFKVDHAYL